MKSDLTALLYLHAGKWLTAAALGVWMTIPAAITTMAAFVFADLVTGLAAAFVQGKFSGVEATRGLVRKILLIGMVLAIHAGEHAVNLEVGLEKWLSAYFVVIQVISIVRNAARAGVPMPPRVVDALVKVQSLYPQPMTAEEVEKAFERLERQKLRGEAERAKAAGIEP